jgi:hypothetical protein
MLEVRGRRVKRFSLAGHDCWLMCKLVADGVDNPTTVENANGLELIEGEVREFDLVGHELADPRKAPAHRERRSPMTQGQDPR